MSRPASDQLTIGSGFSVSMHGCSHETISAPLLTLYSHTDLIYHHGSAVFLMLMTPLFFFYLQSLPGSCTPELIFYPPCQLKFNFLATMLIILAIKQQHFQCPHSLFSEQELWSSLNPPSSNFVAIPVFLYTHSIRQILTSLRRKLIIQASCTLYTEGCIAFSPGLLKESEYKEGQACDLGIYT